jgi:hypothetical protein
MNNPPLSKPNIELESLLEDEHEDADSTHVSLEEGSFEDSPQKDPRKCAISQRFWVSFEAFLGVFLCYMLRVNVSLAIIPMSIEYHWDDGLKGMSKDLDCSLDYSRVVGEIVSG